MQLRANVGVESALRVLTIRIVMIVSVLALALGVGLADRHDGAAIAPSSVASNVGLTADDPQASHTSADTLAADASTALPDSNIAGWLEPLCMVLLALVLLLLTVFGPRVASAASLLFLRARASAHSWLSPTPRRAVERGYLKFSLLRI